MSKTLENPKYKCADDARDAWEIIDRLSRMAWESNPTHSKNVHDAASKFYTALLDATCHLPPRTSAPRVDPPKGGDVDHRPSSTGGWRSYSINRIAELAISHDVGSVAEAFIRSTPVLEAFKSSINDPKAGFVFRGQVDISWALTPKLGRDAGLIARARSDKREFVEGRRTKTSAHELAILETFKKDWPYMKDVDPLDIKDDLSENDPSWWFRMQHYGGSTRLLDVTSSIPAALLFACLDWDTGQVDNKTDGILYLFVEGMSGNVEDFQSPRRAYTDKDLFTDFPEAPVSFLNPKHNERSKAQAGSFVWWPEFWEEYPGQVSYLRIPKQKKEDIARELLLTNFGPKDVVRGEKGRRNEMHLRASLGLM